MQVSDPTTYQVLDEIARATVTARDEIASLQRTLSQLSDALDDGRQAWTLPNVNALVEALSARETAGRMARLLDVAEPLVSDAARGFEPEFAPVAES